MIKETEKKEFRKTNNSSSSYFSIYLQEMILAYEQMLFEGLSRLFLQLQNFLPEKQKNNTKKIEKIKIKIDANAKAQREDGYSGDEATESFISENSFSFIEKTTKQEKSFDLDSIIDTTEDHSSNLLFSQSFDLDAVIQNQKTNQIQILNDSLVSVIYFLHFFICEYSQKNHFNFFKEHTLLLSLIFSIF